MGSKRTSEQASEMVMGLWGEPVAVPHAQARVVADWYGEGQAVARQREHARELARVREKQRWAAGNPMITVVGRGPEGETCRTCVHLSGHRWDQRYHKCALRGQPTHGSATDHRVNWPACSCWCAKADGKEGA